MAKEIGKIQLALFGESTVGKTIFGGQLLSRIETEKCKLKMNVGPKDLTPFEEVRSKLNQGLLASHTSSAVYRESIWPVSAEDGLIFDLTWPDYGGEQIQKLIDLRTMAQEWLERIQSADGWILMIRPDLSKNEDDIFSKPLSDFPKKNDNPQKTKRSTQSRLVELLQLLLHARGLQAEPKPLPSLVILLSCWDELGKPIGSIPYNELAIRHNLISSFIKCHWGDKVRVYGLSALGTTLSSTVPNEDFINLGPENFGFVVDVDGTHTSDLTLPIVDVARMAQET